MSDTADLWRAIREFRSNLSILESRLNAALDRHVDHEARIAKLEGMSRRVESIDDVQKFLIRKVAKVEPITDEDFTQEQAHASPPPTPPKEGIGIPFIKIPGGTRITCGSCQVRYWITKEQRRKTWQCPTCGRHEKPIDTPTLEEKAEDTP